MRLDTISEQPVPQPGLQDQEAGLDSQPLGGGPGGPPDQGAEEMPPLSPEGEGEEGAGEPLAKDESGKAESAIDAVEKLRTAAASLDAASFAMKTDYSDFSLSQRIDQVKQELIYIINKAKEHVEYSAAKDPQAKQRVSQWLNT